MNKRLLACLFLLGCGAMSCLAADGTGLAGRWKLDTTQGSSLQHFDAETLTIGVEGDAVTLDRELAFSHRHFSDGTNLTADGRTVTAVPVKFWLDTWFSNTYIGGDHLKRVTGEWLDGGRILKVETSVVLDGQQGNIPVHIYDEYRVSADGRTLLQFELRSTRDQALSYVFTRE